MKIEDIEKLKELHEAGLDPRAIAKELGESLFNTTKMLRKLKLKPNKEKGGESEGKSHGSATLYNALKALFPHHNIENEHHLADKLFLDYYVPALNLGFEFDGKQHDEYTPHFHDSRRDAVHQADLDYKKDALCEMMKITLIRISYKEERDISVKMLEEKIWKALGRDEDV